VNLKAARRTKKRFARRLTMEWEKPEFEGIALACEISGYANAELAAAAKAETLPSAER
jgi:hypothetical protein